MEPLFHDGDQDVHRDGDPDLRLDGILAGAVEPLDPKMLVDPLEEQFDLPAATIQLRDGQRRQVEVVGEKAQMPVVFGIVEFDASQVLRIILAGLRSSQPNGLIAT